MGGMKRLIERKLYQGRHVDELPAWYYKSKGLSKPKPPPKTKDKK